MSEFRLTAKKTADGRVFYYQDFGCESHSQTSFRLWVHYRLVKKEAQVPYLVFPCEGTLRQGKSNSTLILRPGNKHIYQVEIPCGYEGSGTFEVHDPNAICYEYYVCRLPPGSLGISKGGLIESSVDPLILSWSRTGCLHGAPHKGTIYYHSNGIIENFDVEW